MLQIELLCNAPRTTLLCLLVLMIMHAALSCDLIIYHVATARNIFTQMQLSALQDYVDVGVLLDYEFNCTFCTI